MQVMNLKEFNESYLSLSEETRKAIKELQDLTGKEIIFRLIKNEEASSFFKLKIKLARKIMDNHIIIINEDNVNNKEELNYYIVHEIVHGLRLFGADESDRMSLKMSNSKMEELNKEILSEFMPKASAVGLGGARAIEYCNFLTHNLFQLLANASVDARIEIYIHNNYPGLRSLQKQAQKAYAKEMLRSFNKKDTALIPEWILLRVNAMNYAYLTKITPIIGRSWSSKANSYKAKGFREIINSLMLDLETIDNGQITDIQTINNWAKILDMDKYSYLDNFENINLSYILTN